MIPIMTLYIFLLANFLAFYLIYLLAFYLIFYLVYLLVFYLAFFLIFYLTFLFCLHCRLYMSDPSHCTKYFREEGLTRKCEKGIVQFGLQGQGWVQREGKSREREKNKPLSQALRFAAEESEHKSFIWLGPKTWDSHHIVYRPDTRGRHCRNLRIFQLFPFSSSNKQVFRP